MRATNHVTTHPKATRVVPITLALLLGVACSDGAESEAPAGGATGSSPSPAATAPAKPASAQGADPSTERALAELAAAEDLHPAMRLLALDSTGASDEDVVEVVLELLSSDDPQVRQIGIERAENLDDPRIEAALANMN